MTITPERRPPSRSNLAIPVPAAGDAIDARIMERVIWPSRRSRAAGAADAGPRRSRDVLTPRWRGSRRALRPDQPDAQACRARSGPGTGGRRSPAPNLSVDEPFPILKRPASTSPPGVSLTANDLAVIMAPFLADEPSPTRGRPFALTPVQTLKAAALDPVRLDWSCSGGRCRNPFIRRAIEAWMDGGTPLPAGSPLRTPSLVGAAGAAVAVFKRHCRATWCRHDRLGDRGPDPPQPVEVVPRFQTIPYPAAYAYQLVPTEFYVRHSSPRWCAVRRWHSIVETVTVPLPPGTGRTPVKVRVDTTNPALAVQRGRGASSSPIGQGAWSIRRRTDGRRLARHRNR